MLSAPSTRPRCPRRRPPPPSTLLSARSSRPPRALRAVDASHAVPLPVLPSCTPAGLTAVFARPPPLTLVHRHPGSSTAALTRPMLPPRTPARLTAALAALVRPPAAFFGPDGAVFAPAV
ncbi:hypothetical protein DENSPDRAFT_882505, partial [Dentipellis sp. KUC8613]